MQGSLSASYDQITWVLTSYIVAAAIMTAPVGWLSARFGQRRLFLVSLVGFTAASMLCGIAGSLYEMVLFRLVQGLFGAALVPLSQATMLNIYPPERRGQAMAIWGMGVMVGPILGPTLGGYLTELYNWRYVFFVNLPFGILATAGLALFLPKEQSQSELRFDWFGFAVLAVGLGGLQLMLDRGETKDWFSSTEVLTEAVLGAFGIYLFVVHMMTAERPFVPARLFRDRNFAAGLLVMFMIGMVLLASSALLAPWLQQLGGYPVAAAGLMMAPRGIGTMIAMLIAGRLSNRVDPRKLMAFGVLMLAFSLWRMTGWTPAVEPSEIIWNTVLQGFGLGFVFIPLNVVAFATLDPALRTQGTALLSLLRNVGAAIGISVTETLLAQNTQIEHSVLSVFASPLNRALQTSPALAQMLSPANPRGAAMLDQMITQQAQVIAYNNDFLLMMAMSLPVLGLLFLMRRPKAGGGGAGHAVMD